MSEGGSTDKSWRDKLDEHEKSINAMLLGLSGGLLAFAADYVFSAAALVSVADRVLAGVAVAGASVSIAVGALRFWLRTRMYENELAKLEQGEYELLAKQIDKVAEAHDARIEAGANDLLQRMANESKDEISAALKEYYVANPDAQILGLRAKLGEADALIKRLDAEAALSRTWPCNAQPVP